tara:strand:- start:60 stop:521 length:462 start_codon:yes stop_codon:yes gene_type:complete
MNFTPFENTELLSSLKKVEITEIINNNIEFTPKLGLTFKKNTNKHYEGIITEDIFKIRRILKSGKNSFIPIVYGKISEFEKGTLIRMKLRLHPIITLFLIVFTVFSGSLLFFGTLNWHNLLMFILPYFMCTVFFNYESNIIKTDLKIMLKSKK